LLEFLLDFRVSAKFVPIVLCTRDNCDACEARYVTFHAKMLQESDLFGRSLVRLIKFDSSIHVIMQ